MKPLVSIVIPVFNSDEYLAETIESAIHQSYPNTEIIIIDDGSTDRSLQIAKGYIKHGVNVKSQPNKGASAARNHGISLAKGSYIQFLDADDLLHPDKITHQIQTIQEYSNLILIGSTWQRFDENINKAYKKRPYTENETKFFEKEEWLIDRPYMIPHTWLVSRKLISLAGLWNEKLSFNDDGEFFYRIVAASNGVVIDHRASAYYRSGNLNSLSHKRDRAAMISWLQSVRSYKFIVKQVVGERGNDAVDKSFFELSYNCIDTFPDLIEICKREMYNPNKQYYLSDKLVYNLTKIIGLRKAKKVRSIISGIRDIGVVSKVIYKTKNLIGWSSYCL
ncbi:glycosyltransferase [Gillisia sp. M10.2A]|uniref:Glycosyltransferase n=1 Tax=Gillisia lutea TaxID=2909668 RepID=A0ABS9EJZ0_9FLAO|nr:glycosyltransferase family 2 protein [Gillisia lutea]MCF4102179.1 glycosyltransferase [Gillisia lutea]